jgi:hypothetical protein
MSPAPVLPARPLRIQAAFVRRNHVLAALLTLPGLLALFGYPIWQVGEARAILADQALWKSGEVASEVSVHGEQTSRDFLLHSYKLQVGYLDRKGARHERRVEFDTLITSVSDREEVAVRYDPRDPDRLVLSWAVAVGGARWGAFAFLCFAGVGLGLVFLLLARESLRRVADARAVARASDEIELPIHATEVIKQYGRSTGWVKYRYLVPRPAGKPRKREITFNRRKQQRPLFADAGETRLLALVAREAPDRPVVLRSDLYPFDVPAWEREATLARLEKRAKGEG